MRRPQTPAILIPAAESEPIRLVDLGKPGTHLSVMGRHAIGYLESTPVEGSPDALIWTNPEGYATGLPANPRATRVGPNLVFGAAIVTGEEVEIGVIRPVPNHLIRAMGVIEPPGVDL